jgi:hypothetical protein
MQSNTSTVETLATTDIETRPKLRGHRGRQLLSEDVGELGGCRDVEDANIFNGDMLADEVEVNFNMLGALMLDGFGGEVDRTDVVTVDQGVPQPGAVQLQKQLMEPAGLHHAVDHNAILHLNTRMRDDVLALQGPGDEVVI